VENGKVRHPFSGCESDGCGKIRVLDLMACGDRDASQLSEGLYQGAPCFPANLLYNLHERIRITECFSRPSRSSIAASRYMALFRGGILHGAVLDRFGIKRQPLNHNQQSSPLRRVGCRMRRRTFFMVCATFAVLVFCDDDANFDFNSQTM